jgi:hypothetical protein
MRNEVAYTNEELMEMFNKRKQKEMESQAQLVAQAMLNIKNNNVSS